MNEFSILCRVIGSLFNRQPQDPLLVPLFTQLHEGKLSAQWPLEQDALLRNSDPQALAADYNALFVGPDSRYSLLRCTGRKASRKLRCAPFSPRAACRSAGHQLTISAC
nr:putative phosphatase YcdX [Candidatus Pantoea persica]